jgi:hypothetical protein
MPEVKWCNKPLKFLRYDAIMTTRNRKKTTESIDKTVVPLTIKKKKMQLKVHTSMCKPRRLWESKLIDKPLENGLLTCSKCGNYRRNKIQNHWGYKWNSIFINLVLETSQFICFFI